MGHLNYQTEHGTIQILLIGEETNLGNGIKLVLSQTV